MRSFFFILSIVVVRPPLYPITLQQSTAIVMEMEPIDVLLCVLAARLQFVRVTFPPAKKK